MPNLTDAAVTPNISVHCRFIMIPILGVSAAFKAALCPSFGLSSTVKKRPTTGGTSGCAAAIIFIGSYKCRANPRRDRVFTTEPA